MIVYYAEAQPMRHRLEQIFENLNITAYEAKSEVHLLKMINDYNNNIQLIIFDADTSADGGLALLDRIRHRNRYIPVMVLSSILKKSFYVESMIHGATDFVLKPFEDEAIIQKINSFLLSDTNNDLIDIITFDLSTYLKGEIRKAQKGNYPLTLMFATYHPKSFDIKKNESPFINQMVYGALKSLFWATDVFIRFGKTYYLGVFPFCDERSTGSIKTKMGERFDRLKLQNTDLAEYTVLSVFLTYPNEIDEPDELLRQLVTNVKQKLPYL